MSRWFGRKILQHATYSLYVNDQRRQTRTATSAWTVHLKKSHQIFSFVQDWGCCGRERTFRNDIKLKGRKDFFKPASTEACLSFSWRWSVRIVFSCLNGLTHDSGLLGTRSTLSALPRRSTGVFSFSATPRLRSVFNSSGLNIPARSACLREADWVALWEERLW